jgi:hypothetical protein
VAPGILKMEAAGSDETLISLYQSTRQSVDPLGVSQADRMRWNKRRGAVAFRGCPVCKGSEWLGSRLGWLYPAVEYPLVYIVLDM